MATKRSTRATTELVWSLHQRPRRRLQPGTPFHPADILIGETRRWAPLHLERTRSSASGGDLSASEVRQRVKLPLVLVEDLRKDGRERAKVERESEGPGHRDAIKEMVGALQRLGYDVYPGGAGIAGVYVLADLLAVDRNGIPLFVECLTKRAITAFGAQEKKLALAERVPFCFVGALPEEFIARLPATAYSVTSPRSPWYDTAHEAGILVPPFYREGTFEAHFRVRISKRKVLSGIEVTVPGLRRTEDVSGFLAAMIELALCMHRGSAQAAGWSVSGLEVLTEIPFGNEGRAGSVFRLGREGSALMLRFGGAGVTGEIRGSCDALDLLAEWLAEGKFPVRIEREGAARRRSH